VRERSTQGTVAAAIALGLAAAICLPSTAAAASPSPRVDESSREKPEEKPKGEPVRPGEDLGGDLVYDGFTDKNIRQFGAHAMVYRYPTITTQAECTTQAKETSFPKVNAFPKEPASDDIYLREVGEFSPTGDAVTLYPGGEHKVGSSRTDSESWEHSTSIETEITIKLIVKVTAKYEFKYNKTVSTTKSDETTAKNLTSNKIQDWAYGIFTDIYTLQQSPWRIAWHEQGVPIFAGDEKKAVARWTSAPKAGCYRSADFSTFSAPRSKGPGVVGERLVKKNDKSCTHEVTSQDVTIHPGKDGDKVPNLEKDVSVKINQGTCLTTTGKKHNVGNNSYFQLNKAKKQNGECVEDPDVLCNGYYWINSTEISKVNAKPAPLSQWSNGNRFILRQPQMGAKYQLVTGDEKDSLVYHKYSSDDPPNDHQWKIIEKNGYWQLEKTGGTRNGKCLEYNQKNASTENCSGAQDQQFQLMHAGDKDFYLRAKGHPEKCLRSTQESSIAAFEDCNSDAAGQKWTFAKK
jgi:Ricin-type beta-trefoil lectin domain